MLLVFLNTKLNVFLHFSFCEKISWENILLTEDRHSDLPLFVIGNQQRELRR